MGRGDSLPFRLQSKSSSLSWAVGPNRAFSVMTRSRSAMLWILTTSCIAVGKFLALLDLVYELSATSSLRPKVSVCFFDTHSYRKSDWRPDGGIAVSFHGRRRADVFVRTKSASAGCAKKRSERRTHAEENEFAN